MADSALQPSCFPVHSLALALAAYHGAGLADVLVVTPPRLQAKLDQTAKSPLHDDGRAEPGPESA